MTSPWSPRDAGGGSDCGSGRGVVDDFRDFMSAFYTGVSVITSVDALGATRGMTCTSLTSVTLIPPTLLACLSTASGTLQAILASEKFAVNILHHRAAETAALFGSPYRGRTTISTAQRSPILAQPWLHGDSAAMAECRLSATQVVGTHTVVFGEVSTVRISDDVSPLVFGQRRYHHLLESSPR